MPELCIRPALAVLTNQFPNWGLRPTPGMPQDLKAIMSWPTDERARMAFHGAMHLQAQALLEGVPGLEDDPTVRDLLAQQRKRIGGWAVLKETPPTDEVLRETEKRGLRGEWAGGTLGLTYLLHTQYAHRVQGPISLRKVRALLARKGNPFFPDPPAPRALNDAWEEFQSVAHLWAGNLFLRTWMLDDIATTAEAELATRPAGAKAPPWGFQDLVIAHSLMHLLTLAKTFQDFGLAYVPKHARTPILDGAQLWRVTDLPDWSVSMPLVPFPDDLLERFDDYAADSGA